MRIKIKHHGNEIKLFQLLNPLFIIGCIATFYVIVNQPELPGTGLYFTIPLTFTLCSIIYYSIITYSDKGFGLKVFYIVIFFRYIVLPVLTCYVGHFSNNYNVFNWEYTYAIIMSDLELIVCCTVIKSIYNKQYTRISGLIIERNEYYDDIGIGGLIILIASYGLITMRGTTNLMQSMRFGIISSKLKVENLYSYDIWLAHTLLAFGVIVITSYFQKRNDKHNSFINILLPLVFVGLSCTMIFGNNRMMIVYYALSGLCVLFKAFPKYKVPFILIIMPIFAVVLISFTLIKQFSIDLSATSSFTVITLERITGTLTGYICGIENIAKTINLYSVTGNQMQFGTVFSDIANNTKILGLPGLNIIPGLFSNIPTSVDLATTSTEMVSVCGQTFFFGGPVFGWLFDLVSYVIIAKLLVIFEINSKLSKSIARAYIYTWLSVLFGMTMCYCLETLYAGITYVPFFTWLFVKINSFIRMKRIGIKNTEYDRINGGTSNLLG